TDRVITLAFSENIQPGSGNIEIHRSSDGTLLGNVSITDPSQAAFIDSGINLHPKFSLELGTSYYFVIGPGVVLDAAGNSFAGISSPTTFNFSTWPTITVEHAYVVPSNTLLNIAEDPLSISGVGFRLTDRPGLPTGPRYDEAPSVINYGTVNVISPSQAGAL